MWVSPNHPNPPRPYSPPQETGQRIATFQRHAGEELRVNLAEYEGHPYVSLRVWAPGPDGQLLPIRGKGLSIKVREVAGLAEALGQLAADLDQQGQGQGTAPPVERRQPDRPAVRGHHLPTTNRPAGTGSPRPPWQEQELGPADAFDEFGGQEGVECRL